ncbi:MAG: hypothetical protein WCP32_01030 [Bacteroidota bacterium]
MNIKEIEKLLEKFYRGDSSLQEEKILREFFLRNDVPEQLKIHQPFFQWAGDEGKREITSPDFDRQTTDRLLNSEPSTTKIHLHHRRTRILYIAGIAACIQLLIGVFFTFREDLFNRSTLKRNVTAELAYAEAQEALIIVSSNLNAGLKQVDRLQMLDKGMKNLQLFNKFYQYQTIIINPDEFNNESSKPQKP